MHDWETKDEVFSQLDDIPEGLRGSSIKLNLVKEGNKTILLNFLEIINQIKRDPTLLRRYFIKVLNS